MSIFLDGSSTQAAVVATLNSATLLTLGHDATQVESPTLTDLASTLRTSYPITVADINISQANNHSLIVTVSIDPHPDFNTAIVGTIMEMGIFEGTNLMMYKGNMDFQWRSDHRLNIMWYVGL